MINSEAEYNQMLSDNNEYQHDIQMETKPKYFDRNQARIVFYAIQQSKESGAKYFYMTDSDEIVAFENPLHPREVEIIKAELVLVL